MDDFTLRHRDKENCRFTGGDNKLNGPLLGGVVRKRLADISNLQQLAVPTVQDSELQEALSSGIEHYVDKLEKGNMMLLNVLADRNKTIELARVELQKLRINFQNLQQQNLQLAQSNGQILVALTLQELNMGKDRLKVCQHELGYKNGILKAMKAETALKMTNQTSKELLQAEEDTGLSESLHVVEVVNSHRKTDRRQRSKACGTSLTQAVVSADAPCEETADVGDSVTLQQVRGNDEPPVSVKKPCGKDTDVVTRRMSTGRPLRRAAEKVQSYKEVPVNTKMRRDQ